MADPLDDYVIEALRLRSGKDVVPRLGVRQPASEK